MSDLAFVDSNILIYAHDRTDAGKQAKAQEVVRRCWEDRSGCVSMQVLQEFYVNLTRKVKTPVPPSVARDLVAGYSSWRVVLLVPEDLLDASRLEERFRLHFWDALILAAARKAKATLLFSEDLQHGQEIGGVMVRNPLR